ncbi:Hypothetical predicted protein [Prunus dulcis]|uniref:Uncharacterized protein n=2 Tax=Prunus dulcis TaxID=3755 RepID=A0A5E4GMP4_PRUDU|nr:Hypothetical predicted protein [Prunus dulcis]VVA41010.1 Hypothetical predicted protein [Prunus dulcis]
MAGCHYDSKEWRVVVVTARTGCAARPAVNSGLSSCCRSWQWKLWLLHYFFVPYLHEPIGLRASTDHGTSLCWLCQEGSLAGIKQIANPATPVQSGSVKQVKGNSDSSSPPPPLPADNLVGQLRVIVFL